MTSPPFMGRTLMTYCLPRAAFDFFAVFRADVLLLEAGSILLMEPVERDRGLRLAGSEQLHGHGHEAKRDRGGTDGMGGHMIMIRRAFRACLALDCATG